MIKKNVPLKDFSHYKIGGPAKYFIESKDPTSLIADLKEWETLSANLPENEKRIFILGAGTNLLIDDEGYDGLVIRPDFQFIEIIGKNFVEFGSGVLVADAINFCLKNSFAGFEWAGGLPGTIGGAIRGNAGAFGGELKDNTISVKSLNLDTFKIEVRSRDECNFSYRSSFYKLPVGKNHLIVSGTFKFEVGDKNELEKKVQEKIDYRNAHQPLTFPSAGSTFKNIDCSKVPAELAKQCQRAIKDDPFPVIPVAYLLSEAGLRGKRIGDAEISEIHPNFIINLGRASSSDVLELIDYAQKTIKAKFEIELEPEIMYLK